MTAPFGDASVEVIADFDRFDSSFSRRLRTSVAKGAAAASASMQGFHGTISRTLVSMGVMSTRVVLLTGKYVLLATAISAAGVASAAAALNAAAFIGALAPLGGIIAALPAAVTGAAAAFGALQLAVAGMADTFTALGSGDLDAFNKALANMAPNAQRFALVLKSLRPYFLGLRQDVQNAAFAGLDKTLMSVARNTFPVLRKGLAGIAAGFNEGAREAGGFLSSLSGRQDLSRLFDGARAAVARLAEAFTPVLKAFTGLSAEGSPVLLRMAEAAGKVADRFAAWVTTARDSGRITELIDNAVKAAKDFWGVLKDVGSILSTVLTGAAGGGSGVLATLREMTSTAREFFNTSEGQASLGQVFATIRAAGDPLLDTLGQLSQTIASTLLPIMADLATAVGPGLQPLVDGLRTGLEALRPAAEPVGKAVGALATALTPVAVVGGRLIAAVLGPLAGAFTSLMPPLERILWALGGALLDAVNGLLPPLLSLVGAVVAALPPFLAFGRQLLDAVIPAFAALGPAVSQLLPALGAIVVALAEGLAPILGPLAVALVNAFGPLSVHAGAFVELTNALLPLVPALLQLLPPLVDMVPMFAQLVDLLVSGLVPVLQIVVVPLMSLSDLFARYPLLLQGIVVGILAWTAASRIWVGLQAIKTAWMARELLLSEASAAMNARGLLATAGLVAMTYTRIAAEKVWTLTQAASGAVGQFLLGLASGQIIRDAALTTWTYAKTAALWLWTGAQKAAAVASGIWTGVQWALNAALLANPIGLIVAGVALLIGGIVLAYKNSETFRNVIDAVGRAFVTAGRWIVDMAKVIWPWLRKAFDWTPLGLFIKYFDNIKAAFLTGLHWLGDFFTSVGRWIADFVGWWFSIPGRIWAALVNLVNMVLGVRQRILDALVKAKDWLLDVGGNIIAGLVQGLKDRFPALFDAITAIGKALPKWIKDTLGIASPSKVMYEIGSWAGQGFANGISSQEAKTKAAALRLKLAAEDGASGLWVDGKWRPVSDPVQQKFDAGLDYFGNKMKSGATGRTPQQETQRQKDLKHLAELDRIAAGKGTVFKGKSAQDSFVGGLGSLGTTAGTDMVSKVGTAATKAADKMREKVKEAGKLLGDGFAEGLAGNNAKIKATVDRMAGLLVAGLGKGKAAPVVAAMVADSRLLRGMADNRDAVTKRLATAQKNLDSLLAASDKLRESIADKVRGAFELIPSSGVRSVDALIRQMGTAVRTAAEFARNIETLRGKGLAQPLLQQLAEAGPDKGAAMARKLAQATAAQLGQLNTMSGTLEKAATAAGTSVSTALYGSGIAAARGLVAGLTSQHRQIETAMLNIAKSMAAAIRRALGIRSPSQVMHEVGVQVGAGLQRGVLSQVEPLRRAMSTVGGVVGGPLSGPQLSRVPAQRGAGAAGGAPVIGSLTQNIYPPTDDVAATAQSVVNRIAASI